jgi:HEAT repeat protein
MVDGALALNDRDLEKALKLFTQAWEKNPDDLYSAAKLAQLYFKARADPEAALPFYIALHRANPRFDDGEPAQQRIREILDSRRETMLRNVRPEGLGRFLTCDDASLRAEAAARAAQAKDPRWIETLAELLDDDAEIVRHNADYALFQIGKGAPDALRVRRDEWLGSAKPLLRTRALNLFADLEPQETFPLVVQALRDPDPTVRFLARAMVLDHYYKDSRDGAKARAEYLAREKDPKVLALTPR